MDLITLEKEKLENKYKELCKEEYPGRLGKTFKTKYNFYYVAVVVAVKDNIGLVTDFVL